MNNRFNAGDFISPKFSCVDIWDNSLFNSVGEVRLRDILLVVENSFKRSGVGRERYEYEKLNVDYYVKVLSSCGTSGWIHTDNCYGVT